jgi:hypothetical protein
LKWVTRKRVQVNRTATAWLVQRFIDPSAEFFFVDPQDVETVQREQSAIGFDAPGARYPHRDDHGRCSFEALVDEHCAGDPVLRAMAAIVHGADFSAEVHRTPESAGLRAISAGFPVVSKGDLDTIAKASFLYDALYASLKTRFQ